MFKAFFFSLSALYFVHLPAALAGYNFTQKEMTLKVIDSEGRPVKEAAFYHKVSIWTPKPALNENGRPTLVMAQKNLVEQVILTNEEGVAKIEATQFKTINPTKKFAEVALSFEGVKGPCLLKRPSVPLLKDLYTVLSVSGKMPSDSSNNCYFLAADEASLENFPAEMICQLDIARKDLEELKTKKKASCP